MAGEESDGRWFRWRSDGVQAVDELREVIGSTRLTLHPAFVFVIVFGLVVRILLRSGDADARICVGDWRSGGSDRRGGVVV